MELYISNNHYYVIASDKFLLIDTGCPISFMYEEDCNVDLDGKEFLIKKNNLMATMFNFDDVKALTGVDIEGFIGLDIIKQTNLTLDFVDEMVYFDTVMSDATEFVIPFECDSYINIKNRIVVDDKYVLKNALIDTGAYVSYINKKYLNESNKTNTTFYDYNPMLGGYTGEFYNARITLNGSERVSDKIKVLDPNIVTWISERTENVAPLDEKFEKVADAFLNPRILSKVYVSFDFKNNKIYLGM